MKKLLKLGYKVTYCMTGNIIAKKGQKLYKAESIDKLLKLIA
jgi:hypothetical protein